MITLCKHKEIEKLIQEHVGTGWQWNLGWKFTKGFLMEKAVYSSRKGKKHQTKLISRAVLVEDLWAFCFTAVAKDLNLKLSYFIDLGIWESWLCTVLSKEAAGDFTDIWWQLGCQNLDFHLLNYFRGANFGGGATRQQILPPLHTQ